MNAGSALPGYSPIYAHVASQRYGSRFRRATRAQYTIPVPWTHGLLWPTSPVPGVPSNRYSPFNSHALSQSMDSCTPPNGFRAFFPHQQQNDLLLVNLTNPITYITLTPGSLGWDSLLRPFIHSHHAFHIHSIHTLVPADPHTFLVHIFTFNSLTSLNTAILLTKFP